MRVLVLGGCGFMGRNLVARLRQESVAMRVFDRNPAPAEWNNSDCWQGDLADRDSVREALEGVDVVAHLISTTLPASSNADPVADIETNLVATVHLLDDMADAGASRIIFLSSGGTVYGNPTRYPIPEEHPTRPLCSHGIVKAAIENYLLLDRHRGRSSPVILRAGNPYGPHQSHAGVQGLIGTALNCVAEDKPLTIWGDGSVVRDYIYIDDLIDCCLAVMHSDTEGIFNVGTGHGRSVKDVIRTVAEVTGREPRVRFEPGRLVDVPKIVLDVSLARETFGWEARVPLREGISRTWQYLLQGNQQVP